MLAGKHVPLDQRTIKKRADKPESLLDQQPAVYLASTLADLGHNALAGLDQLPDGQLKLLKGCSPLPPSHKHPGGALVDLRVRQRRYAVSAHLHSHVLQSRVEVTPGKGIEGPSHPLKVLLRHRPTSIPLQPKR